MAENKTEEEILETDTVNEEASSAEEETKEAGNEASAGETEAKEAEEKADKKAEKKEKKVKKKKEADITVVISHSLSTLYIIKHTILADISPETASFSLFLPAQKQIE